jgi:hypothetical protein
VRGPEPINSEVSAADEVLWGMWADNETRIDLLGFEFLVDELLVVLREPRLLPVTVGVAGDWGSGKSSLAAMAEAELAADEGFLTVSFSPWRFEDYEDVKTALMAAVIGALQERAHADAKFAAKARNRLGGLVRRVNLLGTAAVVGRAALAAHGADLPPEVLALGSTQLLKPEPPAEEGEPALDRFQSIGQFREEFAALMDDLDDLQALVVFIDDLDRCLPDTIVDTFEAIRLFLHVPKTAYVIATDRRIAQAAIEARYPANREGDDNLAVDYLEKILQLSINIPPLAEPEAETYINLLFAELWLDAEQLAELRNEASLRRRRGQLATAMNYGIAVGVLGEVPDDLTAAFGLTNEIAPVLARGLRGNPRQLKRFLNILILRRRAAAHSAVELNAAILAKLMILEQLHLKDFQRLFLWQVEQEGRPIELARAEIIARGGRSKGVADEIRMWAAEPHITRWLSMEPELATIDLGPYFYFARDRLSPGAPTARLPAALQELLARLEQPVVATRRPAVAEALALEAEQRVQLFDILLERAARDPRGRALDSAIELAAGNAALADRLIGALNDLPPASVPLQLPAKLIAGVSPAPTELRALLRHWSDTGPAALKRAATEALG